MTSKKVFYGMLAALGLVIAGSLFSFYTIDKQLSEQSKEISNLKADELINKRQVELYEEARDKVEELSYVVDLAEQVLPSEKAQADVIAELRQFIESSGLRIDTLSFGGGATNSTNFDISQTVELEGAVGIRVLPVNISFDTDFTSNPATYEEALSFLRKVENNRRKMQVTSVSLSPNAQDRSRLATLTVQLNVFLRLAQ